jgi:hypothetical protein
MAFIGSDKKTANSQTDEIQKLVKAHGFDPGTYNFSPNTGVLNRKEGSIINGNVKGSFTIERKSDSSNVVFYREDYPSDRQWHRICATFGFKYHNINDIDAFVIKSNGDIEVVVSIVTPTSEI